MDNISIALERSGRWLLYAAAALIPFVAVDRPGSAADVEMSARVIASDIAGSLALLLGVFASLRSNRAPAVSCLLPVWLWTGVSAALAMLAPYSANISAASQLYNVGFIIYGTLSVAVAPCLLVTPTHVMCYIGAFAVGGVAQSIIIWHDVGAILGYGQMWFPDAMAGRLRGTFRMSGQMGQYAMAMLLIGFAALGWPNLGKKARLALLWICASGVTGAFFASRRSAMACIALWAGFVFARTVMARRASQAAQILVGVGVVALLAGYIMFGDGEYAQFASKRVVSMTDRLEEGGFIATQWEDAGVLLAEHLVFGCGLGNAMHFTSTGHEIHNGALALLVEAGVGGVLLIMTGPVRYLYRRLHLLRNLSPIYAEFAGRLGVAFLTWLVFMAHNRVWRDRAFWVAVTAVVALATVVARSSFRNGCSVSRLDARV